MRIVYCTKCQTVFTPNAETLKCCECRQTWAVIELNRVIYGEPGILIHIEDASLKRALEDQGAILPRLDASLIRHSLQVEQRKTIEVRSSKYVKVKMIT